MIASFRWDKKKKQSLHPLNTQVMQLMSQHVKHGQVFPINFHPPHRSTLPSSSSSVPTAQQQLRRKAASATLRNVAALLGLKNECEFETINLIIGFFALFVYVFVSVGTPFRTNAMQSVSVGPKRKAHFLCSTHWVTDFRRFRGCFHAWHHHPSQWASERYELSEFGTILPLHVLHRYWPLLHTWAQNFTQHWQAENSKQMENINRRRWLVGRSVGSW